MEKIWKLRDWGDSYTSACTQDKQRSVYLPTRIFLSFSFFGPLGALWLKSLLNMDKSGLQEMKKFILISILLKKLPEI
jgi:hypothetical protein